MAPSPTLAAEVVKRLREHNGFRISKAATAIAEEAAARIESDASLIKAQEAEIGALRGANVCLVKAVADVGEMIARPIWQAWKELNEILARDGVPYTNTGWKASVDEAWFSRVVDDCEHAYELVTGKKIMPWHPSSTAISDDEHKVACEALAALPTGSRT